MENDGEKEKTVSSELRHDERRMDCKRAEALETASWMTSEKAPRATLRT